MNGFSFFNDLNRWSFPIEKDSPDLDVGTLYDPGPIDLWPI